MVDGPEIDARLWEARQRRGSEWLVGELQANDTTRGDFAILDRLAGRAAAEEDWEALAALVSARDGLVDEVAAELDEAISSGGDGIAHGVREKYIGLEEAASRRLCSHVEVGDCSGVRKMFALGADANWAEGHALVAAIEHLASVAGLEMVQLLVEHGADIHCRRLTRYATALHAAATWGRMEIVEFLLAEGVSVIVDDCDWRTPRDRALLMGHSAIAGRLLDLELLERQEGTYLVDSALVESVTQFLDGFQLPDGNESPVRPFLRDLRIRNEAHRLGKLEAWRLRMWYGNARTLVE